MRKKVFPLLRFELATFELVSWLLPALQGFSSLQSITLVAWVTNTAHILRPETLPTASTSYRVGVYLLHLQPYTKMVTRCNCCFFNSHCHVDTQFSFSFSFIARTHPQNLSQETSGRLRGPKASFIFLKQ